MAGLSGLTFYNDPNKIANSNSLSFGSSPSLNVNQAFSSGGLTSAPAVLPASTTAPPPSNPPPNSQNGSSGISYLPNNTDELNKLNTQFDYLKSQGEGQLTSLSNQYNQSVNEANTALEGVRSTVNQQKESAAQARDKSIAKAGEAAQSTQKQNRQTLRALGILNSSAAGEFLTKPITEFSKVKADFIQAYNARANELDNFLNQKTAENTNVLNSLRSQYNQLVGNIQNDLRFNDRQRSDAINAANSALSARIAELRQAQSTISDRVKAQKLQLLQEAGQLEKYSNPEFNYSDYTNNVLIPLLTGEQPKTVGVSTQDEQRKKLLGLSGLDYNQAIQSGGLSGL